MRFLQSLAMPNRTTALLACASLLWGTCAAAATAATPDAADKRDRPEAVADFTGAGGGWNGGSWRDQATTWTPTTTAGLHVHGVLVDRAAISPDGDGERDEATIAFRIGRLSPGVRVRIEDATGATVRDLGSFRRDHRSTRVTWDGTSDDDTVVADGAYRFVLLPVAEGADPAHRLEVGVAVDTVVPGLSVRRPTIGQLTALARRATELRDSRRQWHQRRGGNGNGRWSRGNGNRGNRGNGHGHGHGRRDREKQWIELWHARQLRLPVTFTTHEDATVRIESIVGGRSRATETWRSAGRHTVEVVLPTYAGGERARITVAAMDDAGNVRRHTVVVSLPRLRDPAPRTSRREAVRPLEQSPATGVPTDRSGPLPDWLDPIMLRATYEAGVPQSWARSPALANVIRRESSFRPTAQNPTSTAYGLFQFLDQTWATVSCTKTSDAYRQSVCGLRYIQRRYRTPERAWAFWQANHWY